MRVKTSLTLQTALPDTSLLPSAQQAMPHFENANSFQTTDFSLQCQTLLQQRVFTSIMSYCEGEQHLTTHDVSWRCHSKFECKFSNQALSMLLFSAASIILSLCKCKALSLMSWSIRRWTVEALPN